MKCIIALGRMCAVGSAVALLGGYVYIRAAGKLGTSDAASRQVAAPDDRASAAPASKSALHAADVEESQSDGGETGRLMVMAGSKSDAGIVGNDLLSDWFSMYEPPAMPWHDDEDHAAWFAAPLPQSPGGYVPATQLPASARPTVMHGSKMPVAFNSDDFSNGFSWGSSPESPPAAQQAIAPTSGVPGTLPAIQPSDFACPKPSTPNRSTITVQPQARP